jgi:4'-phosphopantetheinyl transferase
MIRWLVQSIADHPDMNAGIPPPGLLSAEERARFHGFANPKRREDWLLGRWTAKQLLQGYCAETLGVTLPLDQLIIDAEPGGAPLACARFDASGLENAPAMSADDVKSASQLPLSLSISHSNGYALCAIDTDAGLSPSGSGQSLPPTVGVDIELIEPRGQNFAADFFTDAEIDCLRVAPPALHDLLMTAIWSAKEATLKALRMGLRVDTRRVECRFDPAQPEDWTPFLLTLHDLPAGETAGWWRILPTEAWDRRFVLTLVTLWTPC